MQKKLIALAVAGLASTAAFAQSNVTVYGMVDGYVGNFKGENTRATAVNHSGLAPSRLGFKGAEDLGNGLKAIFTLEYAVNLDTQGAGAPAAGNGAAAPSSAPAALGTNGLGYTRQAFVGLSSATVGTVVAGVLQTPGFDWAVKYNAFGPSGVIDPYNNLAKADANNLTRTAFTANNSDRLGNAIAYVSPNLAGVTLKYARVQGVPTEGVTDATRFEINSLSADYDNGPLSVGAVYQNVTTVAGQADLSVGAKYDFGVAKLFANYAISKNANSGELNARASDSKDKLWSIGASVPVGRGNIVGSYARLNRDNLVNAAGTEAFGDAKAATLAYTYGLSKRTTAYTGYTMINNDGKGVITLGGVTAAQGGMVSGVFAGLNHTF